MIFSLDTNYKENAPDAFHMVKFSNDEERQERQLFPEHIEFKPGLNLVIGSNGSGKTTLIKALWSRSLYSAVPDKEEAFPNLLTNRALRSVFDSNFKIGHDGMADYKENKFFNIKMDFNKSVYQLDRISDMSNDKAMSTFENFGAMFSNKHLSSGEKLIHSLFRFVNEINKKKVVNLADALKESNVPDEMIANYLKEHQHDSEISQRTILMDEPDAGLDIFGIGYVKDLITADGVQIIAAVHNPALIMALKDKANVIEMTPGYLDKVIDLCSGFG